MKKRILLTLAAFLLTSVAFAVPSLASCVELVIPGDANGDGKANIKDAIVMLKHVASDSIEINVDNADVLKDGKVNVKDVMLMLKVEAGWKNVRLGHNDEIRVKSDPTCTAPGISEMKCTVCGDSRLFEISPISHTYKDGVCIFCKNVIDDESERTFESDGVLYEILPDATCSVRATGSFESDSLVIAADVNGFPVSTIPDYAFVNQNELSRIYIPHTVTHIGIGAFEGCDNVEEVSLPFVGENADGTGKTHFGHIFGTSDAYVDAYKIPAVKVVSISGGESIGDSAFQGVYSLQRVSIPNSAKKIGKMAFTNCSGLTELSFGDKSELAEIGDSAFYGCSRLTEVSLPRGLKKIGKGAFMCKSLESISIPASVTRIRDGAFNYCNELKTVNISDVAAWCNITFEGSGANPASLAEALYLDGELLTELVIPEGVTKIGAYAFENNKHLESVRIPSTVSAIGEDAFKDTSRLSDLHIESIEKWCSIEFEGAGAVPGSRLYLKEEEITDLVIPEGITRIPAHAFARMKGITSVSIPDSVTFIGGGAFKGCSSLVSVALPGSITEIADELFCRCTSLTDVAIPQGVVSIGESAFYSCTALSEIVIPANVAYIGKDCFKECTGLTFALFEVTTGWSCGTYDIIPAYLSNATKAEESSFYGNAIEYLTEKYTFNSWSRE